MAIGDRTPTEMIPPTVLGTTAVAVFTNVATNRAQLTGLWLSNTSAFRRVVTLYKNGTSAGNQLSVITLDAGASTLIDLSGKALVFTGAQILAAKQDAGTDVNIAAYGILEQIA